MTLNLKRIQLYSAKRSASLCLSHHGQLSLQLLDAVFLEVELGAQHPCVLRGFLGLPPQVPLLSLQQVLLFGQRLHCILALLADTNILMIWFMYRIKETFDKIHLKHHSSWLMQFRAITMNVITIQKCGFNFRKCVC